MKHYIIILLASLAAILFHGYQFAVSDQEIFIPYILKSADQPLFPQDMLFNQPSANLSIFYPILAFLTKFYNLELIFFVSYLIFQFIFFSVIYRLSKVLLKDSSLAYFSIFPFLLPKFIGGTATQTFDLFFGYRSIGIIFLIFYLSFLFEKKFAKSALVALGGLLFHPLSIIPSLALLPLLKIQDSKFKLAKHIRCAVLALAVGALLLLIVKSFFGNNLVLRDDLWLSIIKSRASYLFISTWSQRAWGALALYLLLIVLSLNKLSKSLRTPVIMITSISFILFLANYFILEVFHVPSVAQLQLVRTISPIAYIGLALSPLLLVQKDLGRKVIGVTVFIFLCFNLYNLNHTSDLNLGNRIQFPKKEDDWINLQKWVSENTAITDKILVPPQQTGFRIFSKRSIPGDIKDGAVVIYDRNYAYYWKRLMTDLENYNSYEDIDFTKLRHEYDLNYLVTLSNKNLNFPIIYRNNTFNLYKL